MGNQELLPRQLNQQRMMYRQHRNPVDCRMSLAMQCNPCEIHLKIVTKNTINRFVYVGDIRRSTYSTVFQITDITTGHPLNLSIKWKNRLKIDIVNEVRYTLPVFIGHTHRSGIVIGSTLSGNFLHFKQSIFEHWTQEPSFFFFFNSSWRKYIWK